MNTSFFFRTLSVLSMCTLLTCMCACEPKEGPVEDEKETPDVYTGDFNNLTATSVEVLCLYSVIKPEAECGLKLYKGEVEVATYKASFEGDMADYTFTLTGLEPETTYSYNAYVLYEGKLYEGYPRRFTTEKVEEEPTAGEIIDMGLSVKWASCNVGASSPEQYGGYYAWGETSEKSVYTNETYAFYNSTTASTTAVFESIGTDICGTEYDVARTMMGEAWRMPTLEEQKELCEKCSFKWTTYNGVEGKLVIAPNGNKLFFPAAGVRVNDLLVEPCEVGCYWSGTLHPDPLYQDFAGRIDFDKYYAGSVDSSNKSFTWNYYVRQCGMPVRAVLVK